MIKNYLQVPVRFFNQIIPNIVFQSEKLIWYNNVIGSSLIGERALFIECHLYPTLGWSKCPEVHLDSGCSLNVFLETLFDHPLSLFCTVILCLLFLFILYIHIPLEYKYKVGKLVPSAALRLEQGRDTAPLMWLPALPCILTMKLQSYHSPDSPDSPDSLANKSQEKLLHYWTEENRHIFWRVNYTRHYQLYSPQQTFRQFLSFLNSFQKEKSSALSSDIYWHLQIKSGSPGTEENF